jgi:hypothetical protein
MNITIDQAIEIYAQGLRHRKRNDAARFARTEAERLGDAGDHEGYQVWNRVAALVDRLDSERTETAAGA